MGCCSSAKSSEEDVIFSFFDNILKEKNFNLKIKNYMENYRNISKISGNNFKKLAKKQDIRLKFIKLIKKEGRSITSYKHTEDLQKILYYIIILTLLLENKMKEDLNDNNNNFNQFEKNNLISLQRDLLSHGYKLFNSGISDLDNNKYIIYYLSKMFYLCFKDFSEANNYLCIKAYINKVKLIVDSNCLDDDEEHYIFVRDSILSIGEYLHYNKLFIMSGENIINILIELYSSILNHHFEYCTNNFSLIKENINKNIRNTTNTLMNFNKNINNKDNILPNITQTFDLINSATINLQKDFKDVKDINLIIESLYYFLNASTQDINFGKYLLNLLGEKLRDKNNESQDNKYNDIILLLIFYECCIKDDEKLTLSLLEYMTELFLNDDTNIEINANDIYYDITLDSYYLIYKNEMLNKQYISLLSQIFMKEIENNNNNTFFISQLIQIYHKKEKMMNKLIKLFFYFLFNISLNYKEKINYINNLENNNPKDINKNINIINNIILNLNSIMKAHFINNNGFSSFNNNNDNTGGSSTNYITYNFYNNKNNNFKIPINEYDILIQNFFNFHDKNEKLYNFEFYLFLHSFIIKNMDVSELVCDFSQREKIYNNLFKIITKLEIILIQDSDKENNYLNVNININKSDDSDKENNYLNVNINKSDSYINDIIMTIQILLTIIEINDTKNYIQDCYILYKSIEKNLKSLLQIQKNKEKGNNKINSFNIKVIYSIIFFILSQFIRLINIPNSMNKNNEDILDYIINSIDEKSGEYLSTINISNFILHNNNSIKSNIQYLKEILLKNENKDSFFINYNTLKQILDIIYSKLFGKGTSLHIFFDNQILNSKYFYNIGGNSVNKSISKASDKITEPKDNSFINHYDNNYNENYIDDISIHIIEQKNRQNNSVNESGDNILMKNDSKINIPFYNEDNATDERIMSNNITNDENPFQNLKI